MDCRDAFFLHAAGALFSILIEVTASGDRLLRKTASCDGFFTFSAKFADSERFIYLLIRPP